MAVRCPYCAHEYDATLFQFDRWILCDCGSPVSREAPRRSTVPREEPGRRRMQELARRADRICLHILDDSYPDVDIAIERARLRERALHWFPGSEQTFDMIYEARFDRLWEQWRRADRPYGA